MSTTSEYSLRIFKENGYYRKKCSVCETPFWTLNERQEVCMDSPCVNYFFDKIAVKRPMNVDEARQTFLDFFAKHGHTVIKPRPVVARWREDLYLTIASIVVFQPHVTSGIVPPPANPLVISQPCIRLEDIDNVGLTLGRHLSIFEMGGHHAFNTDQGWKYWKEETVSFALEFFEKEIGIKREDITFKESWWEGGGNAGPSFEVVSGGLELATLVFMQYRVTERGYEPIPLKIVDTGYGIERIAWFTQKTPTAFHAIYGPLIDETRSLLNITRPEEHVLKSLFIRAGRLKPNEKDSIRSIIDEVSLETEIEKEAIMKTFLNEARVYSIIDHSKTLVFMLADGIVPSNQGEGYLARLVLRRALKQLILLEAGVDILEWLINKQIEMWSKTYSYIRERQEYIQDVISLESKKFVESISTNMPKALSMFSSGTNESLKRIYQEYGIPPEIVIKEYEKRTGIKVEIPSGFYSEIAKESGIRTLYVEKTPEYIDSIPETKRVFHENPYASMIEAKVLYSSRDGVILDQTIFYPTSGGQHSDSGLIITHDGKMIKIKQATNINGRILHIFECPEDHVLLKEGDHVKLVIDWEKRYRLMRHHTATHILLGSLRKVLGTHVWQAGAEKTPEKGRLDITHYKPITIDEIIKIEEDVNRIINMRVPIKFHVLEKNLAEDRYGFSIYQGGVPMTKEIRIVEIPGHDAQACYGTHVSNTGDVGAFKITSIKKIQDGVYRLEFVAGTELVRYVREMEGEINKIANLVGGSGELFSRVKNFVDTYEELKELLSRYRRYSMKKIYEELVNNSLRIGEIRVALYKDDIGDKELATQLLKDMVSENQDLIVIRLEYKDEGCFIEISSGEYASRIVSADTLAKGLSNVFKGKGGGKKDHSFVKIYGKVSDEEIRKSIISLIREKT